MTMTKNKECKTHNIVWDLLSMEIRQPDDHDEFVGDDFDDAVEFTGKCSYCLRTFLKTFVDPRFTELTEEDMVNVFRESIKSQRYMNLESIGGIKT